MVHSLLTKELTAMLAGEPETNVIVESARCVRQRVQRKTWIPGGKRTTMDDSPMDIFRVTTAPQDATVLINKFIEAGDLRTPGHGTIYAQSVTEHGITEPHETAPDLPEMPWMRSGIALLTCILSRVGSGEQIARIALKLGACVPVISRGIGTGIRDRLGLLRITIPPEKEIVRLMIPSEDADGIRRIIVEEGRMERPGAGFIYQTGIIYGQVDPLINIGRQEHAASMEQIIAALDEIKAGTAWRKRFNSLHEQFKDSEQHTRTDNIEITFCCMEGHSGELVQTAMAAGAGGATVARVRCLNCLQSKDGSAARESGVLCVSREKSDAVIKSLLDATNDTISYRQIQSMDAPVVFSYGH